VFDLDNTLARCPSTDDAVLRIVRRYGASRKDTALIGRATSDWSIVEQCVVPKHRHAAYLEILETNARVAATAECREGLGDALRLLSRRYPLFVASGRDRRSLDIVLDAVGFRQLFADIEGASARSPCKPDERVLTALLGRHGIMPAEVVYVGDKEVDRELACRAGADFIGATFYHDVLPDAVRKVHSAADLLHVIDELAATRDAAVSQRAG
jgi:phosphoglycolate phosphatase/pyrophosphatase PpaX